MTDLMGVPVTVENNNSVCSLQVQAEATGSGAEQEDEVLRSFLIKLLQECRSVLRLGGSCNIMHQHFYMWNLPTEKSQLVLVTQSLLFQENKLTCKRLSLSI